jgi:hypothetical protein
MGIRGVFLSCFMLFTLAGQAARGEFLNGGFESGDLTGFETLGNASIETSAFGSGPSEGFFQALLTADDPSASAPSLEGFLGLATGTLDSLGTNVAFNGSAIRQTFTAQAGDTLSLRWNFLVDDVPSLDFNDFAFVVLDSAFVLADTNDPRIGPSITPFIDETGYQVFHLTVASTGMHRLGLGVVNVGDGSVRSGLLIDDIRVVPASVPEPSSLALAGLGALGLLGYGWRRRKRRAA